MIRKTFICFAGVLAGASTGAYVDGFFEKDNVVTRAFDQVASKFDDAGSEPLSGDADVSLQSTIPNSLTDSPTSEGSGLTDSLALADSSSANTTNSLTEIETGTEDNSSQTGMAAKAAVDIASVGLSETNDGVDQLLEPNTISDDAGPQSTDGTDGSDSASASISKGSTNSRSSSDLGLNDATGESTPDAFSNDNLALGDERESVDQSDETEKEQSIAEAKSQALLNVRFTRETFESPTGGRLNYRKLSPRVAGKNRPLPLIVFLHGSGERGNDNTAQLKHGLDYLASREGMQEFPATIIVPQCPADQKWSTLLADRDGSEGISNSGRLDSIPTDVMKLTHELIAETIKSANVDSNRIYVTGLSMGGFGTFDLIARFPSVFAAAVPLCGGGDTRDAVVNRIKSTPFWIIHGDQDPVVDVKYSRELVDALRDAGASPRYSELSGFGHNIWDATYADKELYKWLYRQRRSDSDGRKSPVGGSGIRSNSASRGGTNNAGGSKSRGQRRSSASFSGTIKGRWKVLAATRQGRRADNATLDKMSVVIDDNELLIAIGEQNETAKLEFPKQLDSVYPSVDIISLRDGIEDSKGIFAKQGDKLVVCWGMPGKTRPTTFDSKTGVKTLVLEKQ